MLKKAQASLIYRQEVPVAHREAVRAANTASFTTMGRGNAEESDGSFACCCTRHERPGDRAAEQRDELALSDVEPGLFTPVPSNVLSLVSGRGSMGSKASSRSEGLAVPLRPLAAWFKSNNPAGAKKPC